MEYLVSAQSATDLSPLKKQLSLIFAKHGHGYISRSIMEISATIIQLNTEDDGVLQTIRALPACKSVQINYCALLV